jgi:kojibiose phosphorylase
MLRGVIFDLDGVITDTAEYHYQAWKRLADEEGLPFTRADNEQLRGVSRRQSLLLILGGQELSEARMEQMMSNKNRYYQELLAQVTPDDLLPGVAALLDELDAAALPYVIASSSRNARAVVSRLGMADRLAALVDGPDWTHAP